MILFAIWISLPIIAFLFFMILRKSEDTKKQKAVKKAREAEKQREEERIKAQKEKEEQEALLPKEVENILEIPEIYELNKYIRKIIKMGIQLSKKDLRIINEYIPNLISAFLKDKKYGYLLVSHDPKDIWGNKVKNQYTEETIQLANKEISPNIRAVNIRLEGYIEAEKNINQENFDDFNKFLFRILKTK